jgi:hypothetical protein
MVCQSGKSRRRTHCLEGEILPGSVSIGCASDEYEVVGGSGGCAPHRPDCPNPPEDAVWLNSDLIQASN